MINQPSNQRATLWAVGFWTAVGAALRAVGLNQQLWYDEIVTVMNTVRVPPGQLWTHYFWDNQRTFYSLLAQLSVGLLGEHAWTVRLPAMIAGTMSIPMLYVLGRSVFSRGESLCAAALLAVSYHHIWFSQNARGYTLLMLATLVATWCFLEGQRRSSIGLWATYAVTVALGAYTHLTMVFVAVSHMLIVIWQWLWASYRGQARRQYWMPALAIVASGLLTILLYAPMLDDMWAFYAVEQPKVQSEWNRVDWAAAEVVRGLQIGFGTVLLLAVAVIGLIGCWRFWQSSPLVLALVVIPGLLGLAVMVAAGRNIWPRFFLYVFGNALLIVVHGVWGVAELATRWTIADQRQRGTWSTWLGYALCAVAILQSLRMLPRNYCVPKQDMLAAIAYVEQQRQPADRVVTIGMASSVFQRYYGVDWQAVKGTPEPDAIVGDATRVWLITMFPIHVKAHFPDLAARLDADARQVKTFPATVGGGEVHVWVVEGPAKRGQ